MLPLAIPFPNIGPDIFSVDVFGFTLALRWYAMAYIVGILLAWRLVLRSIRTPRLWPRDQPPMTSTQLEDLLTWIIVGVVVGGRIGYVLFYQPSFFLANPLDVIKVWEGGMSFHGGFLGVVAAVWLFSRRNGLVTASIADAMAFSAPIGLLLGRIANFINAELWGRATYMPWGVIFPGNAAQDCDGVVGPCARHPSQLYEAGLEGLCLGVLLIYLAWWRGWLKKPGQIMGMFLVGYGASRFFVEFFRQADDQFITASNPMGYVIGSGNFGLSMGQTLSLPMILIGIAVILWARRKT